MSNNNERIEVPIVHAPSSFRSSNKNTYNKSVNRREKKLFMNTDITKVNQSRKHIVEQTSHLKKKLHWKEEFELEAKRVNEFGSRGLKGKELKKYKNRRLEKLGVKLPKPPKMPYNKFMEMKKIQKRKLEEQGISVKKNNKDNQHRERGPQYGIGTFNRGVLKLSRDDIGAIQSSGNRKRFSSILKG